MIIHHRSKTLESVPLPWKINAALAAVVFALLVLILLVPMDHDFALMLGLVSMVLILLIVASGAMWLLRWMRRRRRPAKR